MTFQGYQVDEEKRGHVFRVGEVPAVARLITGDEAFEPSAVVDVRNADGDLIIEEGEVLFDPEPGEDERIYELAFLFDTTLTDLLGDPATATPRTGFFSYVIRVTIGDETFGIPGQFCVWPAVSLLDRYVDRIMRIIRETRVGEALQYLTLPDYAAALDRAREVFQQSLPRTVYEDIDHTTDWEYVLSETLPDWQDGLSDLVMWEYPVDDDSQEKSYLEPVDEVVIDNGMDKWRFRSIVPANGDRSRVHYTAPHSLTHTAETIPGGRFASFCRYAAGECLEMLANGAIYNSEFPVGAAIANWQSKQGQFHSQAEALMEGPLREWGADPEVAAAAPGFAVWNYLPWHNRDPWL